MKWLWFALGFVAVALTLLAQWPATMTARWVNARTSLQLVDAQGTVWNGGAERLLVSGLDAGRLEWQLAPLSVLRLQPHAQVQVSGPELNASASLQWSRSGNLVARSVAASLPGEWLQRILADTGLGMRGRVELALDEVRLDDAGWIVAATGVAHWRQARVIGAIAVDVGDLTVTWTSPRPGRIEGRLSDQGGPLILSGSASVENREYQIDAKLRARENNPELRNALYSLARPDGNGQVTLRWQGPMLPVGEVP